ncbi:TPA: hypothetical protein N0F65_000193 [Lagenidium giganteum]|uniref:Uncharacterized protein n=1 Tax=Lagenidium giganteum TaxID=4803 RepID=A0AAV2YGC7_9STRA|nr:TPA: hypothetical protein N0F65_000193 [Lagenidium giganteum]
MAKYPTEPGIQKYSGVASKEIALCSIQHSPTRKVKDTATEILQESSATLDELHNERMRKALPKTPDGRSVKQSAKRKTPSAASPYRPSASRGTTGTTRDPLSFSRYASPIGKAPYLPGNLKAFTASAPPPQRNNLVILDANYGADNMYTSQSGQGRERQQQFVKEERQSLLFETYGLTPRQVTEQSQQGIKRTKLKTHLVTAEQTWATPVDGEDTYYDHSKAGYASAEENYQRAATTGQRGPVFSDQSDYSPDDGLRASSPSALRRAGGGTKKKKKQGSSVLTRPTMHITMESDSHLRVMKDMRSPFAGVASPPKKKKTFKGGKRGVGRSPGKSRGAGPADSLNAFATQLFDADSLHASTPYMTPQERQAERERLSFAEKLHKMIDKAKSTLAQGGVSSALAYEESFLAAQTNSTRNTARSTDSNRPSKPPTAAQRPSTKPKPSAPSSSSGGSTTTTPRPPPEAAKKPAAKSPSTAKRTAPPALATAAPVQQATAPAKPPKTDQIRASVPPAAAKTSVSKPKDVTTPRSSTKPTVTTPAVQTTPTRAPVSKPTGDKTASSIAATSTAAPKASAMPVFVDEPTSQSSAAPKLPVLPPPTAPPPIAPAPTRQPPPAVETEPAVPIQEPKEEVALNAVDASAAAPVAVAAMAMAHAAVMISEGEEEMSDVFTAQTEDESTPPIPSEPEPQLTHKEQEPSTPLVVDTDLVTDSVIEAEADSHVEAETVVTSPAPVPNDSVPQHKEEPSSAPLPQLDAAVVTVDAVQDAPPSRSMPETDDPYGDEFDNDDPAEDESPRGDDSAPAAVANDNKFDLLLPTVNTILRPATSEPEAPAAAAEPEPVSADANSEIAVTPAEFTDADAGAIDQEADTETNANLSAINDSEDREVDGRSANRPSDSEPSNELTLREQSDEKDVVDPVDEPVKAAPKPEQNETENAPNADDTSSLSEPTADESIPVLQQTSGVSVEPVASSNGNDEGTKAPVEAMDASQTETTPSADDSSSTSDAANDSAQDTSGRKGDADDLASQDQITPGQETGSPATDATPRYDDEDFAEPVIVEAAVAVSDSMLVVETAASENEDTVFVGNVGDDSAPPPATESEALIETIQHSTAAEPVAAEADEAAAQVPDADEPGAPQIESEAPKQTEIADDAYDDEFEETNTDAPASGQQQNEPDIELSSKLETSSPPASARNESDAGATTADATSIEPTATETSASTSDLDAPTVSDARNPTEVVTADDRAALEATESAVVDANASQQSQAEPMEEEPSSSPTDTGVATEPTEATSTDSTPAETGDLGEREATIEGGEDIVAASTATTNNVSTEAVDSPGEQPAADEDDYGNDYGNEFDGDAEEPPSSPPETYATPNTVETITAGRESVVVDSAEKDSTDAAASEGSEELSPEATTSSNDSVANSISERPVAGETIMPIQVDASGEGDPEDPQAEAVVEVMETTPTTEVADSSSTELAEAGPPKDGPGYDEGEFDEEPAAHAVTSTEPESGSLNVAGVEDVPVVSATKEVSSINVSAEEPSGYDDAEFTEEPAVDESTPPVSAAAEVDEPVVTKQAEEEAPLPADPVDPTVTVAMSEPAHASSGEAPGYDDDEAAFDDRQAVAGTVADEVAQEEHHTEVSADEAAIESADTIDHGSDRADEGEEAIAQNEPTEAVAPTPEAEPDKNNASQSNESEAESQSVENTTEVKSAVVLNEAAPAVLEEDKTESAMEEPGNNASDTSEASGRIPPEETDPSLIEVVEPSATVEEPVAVEAEQQREESSVEQPVEQHSEPMEPIEQPIEQPSEPTEPTEQPAVESAEQPSEEPVEEPAEQPVERPPTEAEEQLVKQPLEEQAVESPEEKPVEVTDGPAVEIDIEQTADEIMEQPAEETPTERPPHDSTLVEHDERRVDVAPPQEALVEGAAESQPSPRITEEQDVEPTAASEAETPVPRDIEAEEPAIDTLAQPTEEEPVESTPTPPNPVLAKSASTASALGDYGGDEGFENDEEAKASDTGANEEPASVVDDEPAAYVPVEATPVPASPGDDYEGFEDDEPAPSQSAPSDLTPAVDSSKADDPVEETYGNENDFDTDVPSEVPASSSPAPADLAPVPASEESTTADAYEDDAADDEFEPDEPAPSLEIVTPAPASATASDVASNAHSTPRTEEDYTDEEPVAPLPQTPELATPPSEDPPLSNDDYEEEFDDKPEAPSPTATAHASGRAIPIASTVSAAAPESDFEDDYEKEFQDTDAKGAAAVDENEYEAEYDNFED